MALHRSHTSTFCAPCVQYSAVRFVALLIPILESLVSLSHHDAFSVDFWNFLGDLRFGNEANTCNEAHSRAEGLRGGDLG